MEAEIHHHTPEGVIFDPGDTYDWDGARSAWTLGHLGVLVPAGLPTAFDMLYDRPPL
ncbi:hypothetical protein SBA6_300002 [Candidatus Sulfopaludibacter sp. SbA6]|nr:hypothetical protein SBA6_300002 [Candidatus Sulfopaludibacter sp. SbA6]